MRPGTAFPQRPGFHERTSEDGEDDGDAPPSEEEIFGGLRHLRFEMAKVDKVLNVIDWQLAPLETKVKCFSCKWRLRDAVLLPCKHRPTCATCAPKYSNCPVCSEPVTSIQADPVPGQMSPEEQDAYLKRAPTDIEIRTSKVEQVFYLFDRMDLSMVPRSELARFFVEFYAATGTKISEYDLDSMMKLVRIDELERVTGDEFVKFVTTFTASVRSEDFLRAVNEVLRNNNLTSSWRPSTLPPLSNPNRPY